MATNLKEYIRESIEKYLTIIKDRFNGDSSIRFKVADAINSDEAISKGQFDDELSGITFLLEEKADVLGNPSNKFKVADAVSSDEAVNKGQLDAEVGQLQNSIDSKANITGDEEIRFKVNNGVSTFDSINKGQFDAELMVLQNNIDSKANLHGDSYNTFSVSDATDASHAVNKGQLDFLNIRNDNGRVEALDGTGLYAHTKKTPRYTIQGDSIMDIDIKSQLGNGIIGFTWDALNYPQAWLSGLMWLDMGTSPLCRGILIADLPLSNMQIDFSNSSYVRMHLNTDVEPTLDNCLDGKVTFGVWQHKLRVVNMRNENIYLEFFKLGF